MPKQTLSRVGLQLLFGVALFIAIDHTLFSSFLYFHVVAWQSTIGMVAQALDSPNHVPNGRRAVLLLGDSRVGEGFSARMADELAGKPGWTGTFVNSAVAGSHPRDWYFILRQMRVAANRFAGVAVMTTTFQDSEGVAEPDLLSDIALIHPLLGFADLPDIAEAFPSRAARLEALKAVLLRGYFYKADVADLLVRPWSRMRNVQRAWLHGFEYVRNYPGRPPSLAGLGFDRATDTLFIPNGLPPIQTEILPLYAQELRADLHSPAARLPSAEYRRLWFGRIADICAEAGIPLFVFRIPRGPLHHLVATDAGPIGVLSEMRDAGRLNLLPATLFDGLERPEYFFDALHMNAAGRAIFSTLLASSLVERIQTTQ